MQTKHFDTRYHWIKEFIDDEIVQVKYIKSEENVRYMHKKPTTQLIRETLKLITNVGFL